MYRRLCLAYAAVLAVANINAAPAPTSSCKDASNFLSNYPSTSATQFCSSLLGITAVIVTSIKTSTASSTSAKTVTTQTVTVTAPSASVHTTTTITASSCSIVSPASPAKHKRAADIEPRAVSTPSTALSSACSCLSLTTPTQALIKTATVTSVSTRTIQTAKTIITTPTRTLTVTKTTTTPCLTPATTCGNEGLEWAYYTNTVTNTLYFTPTPYKTIAPIATGTLFSPGGFRVENAVSTFSPYGSTRSLASKRFVLQHRGWLFAPVSGTYTFTITDPDDSIYLWVGSDQTGGAYTGWTRDNTLISGQPDSRPAKYLQYMTLRAGDYVPYRVMLVQWAGGAGFGIQIVAPGGVTLAESGKASRYLVRFDCGGEGLAPRFLPWGEEY